MNEWISVKDRLPVVVKAKNGNRSVNRAYYMDGYWHGSGSQKERQGVTNND